jgi:hypothetical protein
LDDLASFTLSSCKKIKFLKKLNRLVALIFAIACILLGIVYYQYYRAQIATEFMFGVDEETNKLVTKFASQDSEIAQKLLPAYKNEFGKIAALHADEWLALMKTDMQTLSRNTDISASLDRVEQQSLNLLASPDSQTLKAAVNAFPHLKDSEKQKKALERLKTETPELLNALKNKYTVKIEEPVATPLKSPNQITTGERDELLRTFLHYLQMATDRGLLNTPTSAAPVPSTPKGGK